MSKLCPKCHELLEKSKGVIFSKPHNLTQKEFLDARNKGVRYDCPRCEMAVLFFKHRIYYWERRAQDDGFLQGWLIWGTDDQIKVQFT
jgi:uncharacterized C2H2 Zn-finger protein